MSVKERLEQVADWGLVTQDEMGVEFVELLEVGWIEAEGELYKLSHLGRSLLGKGHNNLGWRLNTRILRQKRSLALQMDPYLKRGYRLEHKTQEVAILERDGTRISLIVNSYGSSASSLVRLGKNLPGTIVTFHPEPKRLERLKGLGWTVLRLT
jgi:hypothetical protein